MATTPTIARICGHRIPESTDLTTTTTTAYDPSIGLCEACITSHQFISNHETAQEIYTDLLHKRAPPTLMREALDLWYKTKVIVLKDHQRAAAAAANHHDDDGASPTTIENPATPVKKPNRRNTTVTFAPPPENLMVHPGLPEGVPKRAMRFWDRSSESYVPGKWAAATGAGFEDHSNPKYDEEEEEKKEEGRGVVGGGGGSGVGDGGSGRGEGEGKEGGEIGGGDGDSWESNSDWDSDDSDWEEDDEWEEDWTDREGYSDPFLF
jgi:hypothetical protein